MVTIPDIEQPSDNLEIDEIMAKLEQDNKFLAELEKQRQGKTDSVAEGSPSAALHGGPFFEFGGTR